MKLTARDNFVLLRRGEGVAGTWSAGVETLLEPVSSLGGGTVGEFVGHDTAGLHFLQVVVANGGRGVHGGFYVALFQ